MKKLSILLLATMFLQNCASKKTAEPDSPQIRINQIGYNTHSTEKFIAADVTATSFNIVDMEGKLGFVVEGPNFRLQDKGSLNSAGLQYASELPAKAYIDVVESYASNEICINWNAPCIYMLGFFDSNKSKLWYRTELFNIK
jgi:hypothetical protein